eukprot:Clim_evm8s46 gene=Clim_evmTU8s46
MDTQSAMLPNRYWPLYLAMATTVVGVLVHWVIISYSISKGAKHKTISGDGTGWTLRGRTVVITGASSGLGEQIALESARMGASTLVLAARRIEELKRVRDMIVAEHVKRTGISQAGDGDLIKENGLSNTPAPTVHLVVLDVAGNGQDLQNFVDRVIALCRPKPEIGSAKGVDDRYSPIALLVHCAGMSMRSDVEECGFDLAQRILRTNFLGAAELTRLMLPLLRHAPESSAQVMRRICSGRAVNGSASAAAPAVAKLSMATTDDSDPCKQGRILVISSLQGLVAIPRRAYYSASKHAVQAYFDALREEIWDDGIRVCVASPGYMKTQHSMNAVRGDGQKHGKMDETQLKGLEPDYVAERCLRSVHAGESSVILSHAVSHRLVPWLHFWFPDQLARFLRKRADQERMVMAAE